LDYRGLYQEVASALAKNILIMQDYLYPTKEQLKNQLSKKEIRNVFKAMEMFKDFDKLNNKADVFTLKYGKLSYIGVFRAKRLLKNLIKRKKKFQSLIVPLQNKLNKHTGQKKFQSLLDPIQDKHTGQEKNQTLLNELKGYLPKYDCEKIGAMVIELPHITTTLQMSINQLYRDFYPNTEAEKTQFNKLTVAKNEKQQKRRSPKPINNKQPTITLQKKVSLKR
jgi:hypothetical protein